MDRRRPTGKKFAEETEILNGKSDKSGAVLAGAAADRRSGKWWADFDSKHPILHSF